MQHSTLQDEAEADALRPTNEEAMGELRGDADGGDEVGEEYDEEFDGATEEAELEVQQVWVLCGGSGSEADASLASGLHVYHELLKQADVLVRHPFILSTHRKSSRMSFVGIAHIRSRAV